MSARQLGHRCGVTQSAISELERSENQQTITLKSLNSLAAAMNCEVHYILVPREPLSKIIADRARQVYEREQKAVSRTMALENQLPQSDSRESIELAYFQLENESRLWDEP